MSETGIQLLLPTAAYHSLTAYGIVTLQPCRRVMTYHSACPLPHIDNKSCMGVNSGRARGSPPRSACQACAQPGERTSAPSQTRACTAALVCTQSVLQSLLTTRTQDWRCREYTYAGQEPVLGSVMMPRRAYTLTLSIAIRHSSSCCRSPHSACLVAWKQPAMPTCTPTSVWAWQGRTGQGSTRPHRCGWRCAACRTQTRRPTP